METEKRYLFSNGGVIEAPDDWYSQIPENCFTDKYEDVEKGLYMHLSDEQLKFNLANPGLDLYHAFYMIPISIEEKNEEIRKQRELNYLNTTDRLYMSYIKYKEFGDTARATEAYNNWKNAVIEIETSNPYIVQNGKE